MKHSFYVVLSVLLVLFIAVGCKKNRGDYPLSNLRAISGFSFEYYHNAGSRVLLTCEGEIDEVNREIKVSVPHDADLTHLCPTIKLSPWTTCSPGSLVTRDFSQGSVEYEVTAQSGKKAYYLVTVTADLYYEDASLVRLYLADIPSSPDSRTFDPTDPLSGKSGTPDSYNDKANLIITFAYGTMELYDLSEQRIYLDLSPMSTNAKMEVSESLEGPWQAFAQLDKVNLNDDVYFRITSETGHAVRYRVHVKENDPEIL